MKCYLYSFLRANLLFCLGVFMQCGEARVLTEAPMGPLYRVVGAPLSISCNVSGFRDETLQKDFEFRIRKPAKQNDFNIISTKDPNFAYAMYSQRVRANSIVLKRISPNSVVFEIERLQKDDEGDYECTVVNSELVYIGIYSVKTTVKVIDDSLSVTSPDLTTMSYDEGESLSLTCQASSNTIQHTHLSFAWYLEKDGENSAQTIISLDRDFTLIAGQEFNERYQDGLIRLDKLGEATYQLKVAQLQLSDSGRIYCQAEEWIQDPDRSWYCITQKKAEEMTLNVKAREMVPDMSSLAVRISAQQTELHEGQELSLSCNIDIPKLEERFFSVAWLRENVELARIGPTGILSVGPEYSGREKEGELRAARLRDRDYRLILQPVRTEDKGAYICRAWPQERGQDGAFTQGAAQDSNSLVVSIAATESGLSVQMQGSVSVNEGERLKLTCKVGGVKGQLSVTWQHKSTSTSAQFTNVISLSPEGVMEKEGNFKSRKVIAVRPTADTFTLELDEVAPSDSGVYQCAVSEWKTNSKTNSQSQITVVTVTIIDTFVKVSLKSRNSRVTVGENVELMCRVTGPRMPVTVTWSRQRDATTIDNILTLYFDGSISWSGDQHRYQLKVENQLNQVIHYLIINSASHREEGNYQCSVSVFLHNARKKLPPSNSLAVRVENPESNLKVNSTANLKINVGTDIILKCSVTSKTSASSRLAVTWMLKQDAENSTIVKLDKDATMTFGPQIELRLRQRISTRQTNGPSFEFIIQQAKISDSGSYICEVVEWLQDPHGDWYELPPASAITVVTAIEPVRDLRLGVKEQQQLIVTEGDKVELNCDIISRISSPPSFYKVAWLYTRHNSSTMDVPLVELDHTGLLRYPENQILKGLQGRLHLSRPNQTSFSLGIQRAHGGDSGTYQCQVEQYQWDNEDHWQQKASDKGGPVTLTVNVTGEGATQGMHVIWIGVLAALVVCSLLVILALVVKTCQRQGSAGKKPPSLWAEELPLNTKPGAED